jgi:hypothetical protein
MKFFNTALLATSATLVVLGLGASPSQAGTLSGGWDYAIDSFTDGSDFGVVGAKSNFEFYGIAVKATADKVFVGINSNLSLSGYAHSKALNGSVAYGDLFFNFTGLGLDDASGNLFAIKFAEGNDSGVNQLGVYSDVTGQNTAKSNLGYKHLTQHTNDKNTKDPTMGDLSNTDAYFQSGVNKDWKATTLIKTGTFLGGIDMLGETDLSALGLDFTPFGTQGKYTFGFSFDRNFLPDGDYIAHVFAECLNDGMAIASTLPRVEIPVDPESVPEPGAVVGLLVLGGLAIAQRRQQSMA